MNAKGKTMNLMKYLMQCLSIIACAHTALHGSFESAKEREELMAAAASSSSSSAPSLPTEPTKATLGAYEIMTTLPGPGGNIGLPEELKNIVYGYMDENWIEVKRFNIPHDFHPIALSDDKRMMVVGNPKLNIFTANEKGRWESQPITLATDYANAISSLSLSHNKRMIIAAYPKEKNIQIWTADQQGIWAKDPIILKDAKLFTVLSHDKRMIIATQGGSSSQGKNIMIWIRAKSNNWIGQPPLISKESIHALTLSIDKQMIVSAHTHKFFKVWTTKDQVIWTEKTFKANDAIMSLALSPDKQMIILGLDNGKAEIWTVDEQGNFSLDPANVLHGHTTPIHSIALSPDKQMIVSGSDEEIKIWTHGKGIWQEKLLTNIQDNSFNSLALSADKHMIAAAFDKEIVIWELKGSPEETFLKKEELGPKVSKLPGKSFIGYAQADLACMEFIKGPKKGTTACYKKGVLVKPEQAVKEFDRLKQMYELQNKK